MATTRHRGTARYCVAVCAFLILGTERSHAQVPFAAARDAWHQVLEGAWTYQGRAWPSGPGGRPVVDSGSATITATGRGRSLMMRMEGSQFGEPFEGVGLLAFDTRREKVQSSWTDNTSGAMFTSEGHLNGEGNVIRFFGRSDGPGERDFDRWWRIELMKRPDGGWVQRYYDLSAPGEGTLLIETVFTRRR